MWRVVDALGTVSEPLAEAEILARLERGEIDGKTLVWAPGMDGWQPLLKTEFAAWCPPSPQPQPGLTAVRPAREAVPPLHDVVGVARSLVPLGFLVAGLQLAGLVIYLVFWGHAAAQSDSVSGWLEQRRLERIALQSGETSGFALLIRAVTLLQLFFFCLMALQFLRWQWRAAQNVRLLGAKQLNHEPFLSLLWWLVPLLNLLLPFLVLSELARASSQPQQWRSLAMPKLVRWCWWAWLASVVLALIWMVLLVQLEEGSPTAWLQQMGMGAVYLVGTFAALATLLNTAAILLLMRLAMNLSEDQVRQATVQVRGNAVESATRLR